MNGDLKKGDFAAGLLVVWGGVALALYFGIAYVISRYNPKQQVIKYAFYLWVVGVIIAFFVIKAQKQKKEEDKKFQGGKLYTQD